MGAAGGEHLPQSPTRVRRLAFRHALRRAGDDDLSSPLSAFGTEIDHVIRRLDDVEVVLDDEQRVARFHELAEGRQQLGDVF